MSRPGCYDWRCISRRGDQKFASNCDCKTWRMIDRESCLPGPAGHCGCYFSSTGAPIPGACCICEAIYPSSAPVAPQSQPASGCACGVTTEHGPHEFDLNPT